MRFDGALLLERLVVLLLTIVMNYWRYDQGDAPLLFRSLIWCMTCITSTGMLLAVPHVGKVVRSSKKEQRIMRYILVLLLTSEECEPRQPSEPAVRTTTAQ